MQTESLFDLPRARASDPSTAHEAAHAVRPGTEELNIEIIRAVRSVPFPVTAFDIARMVQAFNWNRWDEGTIRTRVSALGKQGRLVRSDNAGLSPRGQRCARWFVPQRLRSLEDVPTGGRL